MNMFRKKQDAPGVNIRERQIKKPISNDGTIHPSAYGVSTNNPAGGKYDPVHTEPKGMDAPGASNDQRWSSMKNGGYYKQ